MDKWILTAWVRVRGAQGEYEKREFIIRAPDYDVAMGSAAQNLFTALKLEPSRWHVTRLK